MFKYADVLKQAFDSRFSGTITGRQRMQAPEGFYYDPETGNYHNSEYPERAGYSSYEDAASQAAINRVNSRYTNATTGDYSWSSGEGAKYSDPKYQKIYDNAYRKIMRRAPKSRAWEQQNTGNGAAQTAVTQPGSAQRTQVPRRTQVPQYRQADTTVHMCEGFR